jgi:hypothetical protein
MGRPGLPNQLRRESRQQIRIGLPIFKAEQVAGVPMTTAQRWHRHAGGVNPYPHRTSIWSLLVLRGSVLLCLTRGPLFRSVC